MIWNQHLLYQIIDVWYHIRKLYLINNEKNDKIKLYHFFYKRRPIRNRLCGSASFLPLVTSTDVIIKDSFVPYKKVDSLTWRSKEEKLTRTISVCVMYWGQKGIVQLVLTSAPPPPPPTPRPKKKERKRYEYTAYYMMLVVSLWLFDLTTAIYLFKGKLLSISRS